MVYLVILQGAITKRFRGTKTVVEDEGQGHRRGKFRVLLVLRHA